MKLQYTLAFLFYGIYVHAQMPLYQWARSIGGPADESQFSGTYYTSIASDDTDNAYMIANVYQDSIDLDPGPLLYSIVDPSFGPDFFMIKLDTTGKLVWANHFAAPDDQLAIDLVFANDYLYITGGFDSKLDFDTGSGIDTLVALQRDVFITKYDQAGKHIWARQFAGGGQDFGTCLAVDDANNVYAVGTIESGIVDFDPGPGTYYLDYEPSQTYNPFISKLDVDGKFVWAKHFISTGLASATSISLDAMTNCYVVGMFEEQMDVDPLDSHFSLTPVGGTNCFLAKFDLAGGFQWARKIACSNDIGSYSSVADAQGNLYISGNFKGTADFDPSAGIYNLVSSPSADYDMFIAKYTNNGTLVWAQSISSDGLDLASGIKIGASGYLYITGKFSGTVDFDAGSGTQNQTAKGGSDAFILILDNAGNYISAAAIGSTEDDLGFDISLDGQGSCYMSGIYHNNCDFNPDAGIANLATQGGDDYFIARYEVSASTALPEVYSFSQLEIYPNPATQSVSINCEALNAGKTTIRMIDVMGKEIRRIEVVDSRAVIDVSTLENGIYFLQLLSEFDPAVQKLVVQH